MAIAGPERARQSIDPPCKGVWSWQMVSADIAYGYLVDKCLVCGRKSEAHGASDAPFTMVTVRPVAG